MYSRDDILFFMLQTCEEILLSPHLMLINEAIYIHVYEVSIYNVRIDQDSAITTCNLSQIYQIFVT